MYIVVAVLLLHINLHIHYFASTRAVCCRYTSGPIDSNSVNCGLTIYRPSIPLAPIAVYLFLITCVVVCPLLLTLAKGWFVAMVHIDPIKADLVSCTKIYGQDKLILTQ